MNVAAEVVLVLLVGAVARRMVVAEFRTARRSSMTPKSAAGRQAGCGRFRP